VSEFGAAGAHGEEDEPVIKDNRRIDPLTGKVREAGVRSPGPPVRSRAVTRRRIPPIPSTRHSRSR